MTFYPAAAALNDLYNPDPNTGYQAWNYPPVVASGGAVAPTSGVVYLVRLPSYGVFTRTGFLATNIVIPASSVGTNLTAGQCSAGLYDSNGNPVGNAGDISGQFAAAGMKALALSGGPVLVTSSFLFAALLFNNSGGGNPQIARGAGAGIGSQINTDYATGSFLPFGAYATGATALPGTLNYANILTTNNPLSMFIGVS